jgi:hypothetical protein
LHNCTSSCLRSTKRNGARCRYGFPREYSPEFKLNSIEKCVKSRYGKRVVKLYNLERKFNERYVNDYNEALLLCWGANVDVQFVGEVSAILNKYITSYVCKAEKCSGDAILSSLMNENRSVPSALQSAALRSLSTRQVGACEASLHVRGMSMHGSSDAVKYLHVAQKV